MLLLSVLLSKLFNSLQSESLLSGVESDNYIFEQIPLNILSSLKEESSLSGFNK